ncbi:DUF3035 domain-containing protein [Allosphingosinicella sp.]|jgi:hypothetical protein|uniref:DUF3035 domain-containing protein n=1 Tax=Allosphingosinicella sp. TaxID=2823234 RepID=UPI002F195C23
MRIALLALAAPAALALAGCNTGGVLGRDRPDEFAVARTPPLVVPPDFALTPPRPGEPATTATDARTQALQALFGGPAPRSDAERTLLQRADADRAVLGARSVVADPATVVVDRGALVQTILALPAGPGREATVTTPQ